MSEISREEQINTINKWLSCNECDTNECLSSICVDCKNYYDEDKINISLKQAVSDMHKLEQIEEVISAMENNDDETVESFAFREIEQILKGIEK